MTEHEQEKISLNDALAVIRRQMIKWSVEYQRQSSTNARLFAESGDFENCQEAARQIAIAKFLEKVSPRITPAMVAKWLKNQNERFGINHD